MCVCMGYQFDPINMTSLFVLEEADAAEMVRCGENHIYAATTHDFEAHMSKIDTTNNLYWIVENCVDSFRQMCF